MKKIIGMAVVAAAVVACGSEKKPEMSNQVLHANAPDWVNRGSGAFGGEKGKIFYGVGIASHIPNAALRRATADARARSEITKTLNTYVAVLNKDYQASTTAGERKSWRISADGFGIPWPDIDEDLTVEGLLRGAPAASRPCAN